MVSASRAAICLSLWLAAAGAAAAVDPVAVDELLRNARVWQQLGRDDKLRLVLEKLLAIDAGQPQALLGLGGLALREGKTAEAQRLLAQLQRSPAHDAPAAAAELQDLIRLYSRELPRLQQLRLLRRGGNTERAAALARELFPGGRAPGALATEFAGLLSGAEVRRTAAARGSGGRSAAVRAPATVANAAPAGAPSPDDPAAQARAVSRLAALLQQSGRIEEALELAARAELPEAVDVGAVRDAATAEVARGRPGSAARLLESALALRPADPWLRHDLARIYAGMGQMAPAREVLAEGLAATAPGSDQAAEMRYAAALAYASWGQDDEALATLALVQEAHRSEGQLALATRLREGQVRRVAEAQAQQAEAARRRIQRQAWRQPTEEVALLPFYRRATDGLSTLRGVEVPIVVTRPVGDPDSDADNTRRAQRWLHVDAVRLDAGALPAAFDVAEAFGQVRASGQPLPADLRQRARGLNLGVGYGDEERRWDVGITGAGFEVPNLVGGWRRPFTLAGQDLSIELSRRALTGGLLPYAGTRDPVSGRRWGGVTQSGATLRWSDDDAVGWSRSASLRASLLAGRNVARNDTVQLRLATDRDTIDTPALRLNLGATLSLWHYRRNLGFHSFGQGGYYSPQRYVSLAVPVQAQGRSGPWSYKVRASLGLSSTFEADTPYYPTDAALQAAAGNPVHAGGGSGGGTSRSLRADIERRLAPHWSAGASFSADRSAYYAPTQWLFYLRHHGAEQTGEVPLPRPVLPYSQF